MSDGEPDLFDEGFEEHIGVNDVFGQDDANLEDEGALLEDEGFQDEPLGAATPATHEVLDRRKALLQLAKRAKAAEDDSGPKKKRHKSGKHAAEVGSRPQRSRRGQAEGSEEREQQPRQFAEVNEDEIVETDADRNFIDDEGVPEEERYEEDLGIIQNADEAEEGEPDQELAEPTNIIDEVLLRRKRVRRPDDQEIDAETVQLTAMMNSLAEADARNMDLRPPRPAIEKLKALDEVCRTLRQRKYRDSFLAVKGLNAFAAWLRPYSNGTLPNAKIRNELVGILKLLQLDTSREVDREYLEASELGKIIMFYFKNPNESMPLRSECRDLIQAWSAPIFADKDEDERKRRQRERAHRQRQAAEKAERERRDKQEREESERRKKLLPRDVGFRARASVPQPSKMDFVINPGKSSNDPFDAQKVSPGGSAPKNMQSPIGGRLGKVLQQRKRGVRDRMGGVSVEGRGIQL